MDEKDIRTLHILESVERAKPPSQRDLSRELNISVGLVNAFIKRLVKKGFFKATHIPKNRIRYILTAEGAAEKTRLTYDYIQHSYRLYKNAHRKLNRLFSEMEAMGVRQIVLCGAGDIAEIANILLSESPISLIAIVDDDRAGSKMAGKRVAPLGMLNSVEFDKILIASTEADSIVPELLKLECVSDDTIVTL